MKGERLQEGDEERTGEQDVKGGKGCVWSEAVCQK